MIEMYSHQLFREFRVAAGLSIYERIKTRAEATLRYELKGCPACPFVDIDLLSRCTSFQLF